MRVNEHTGEINTESRKELSDRYFGGMEFYGQDNMGMITLMSRLQHQVENGFTPKTAEYYIKVLNDMKALMIEDNKKKKKELETTKISIVENNNLYFLSYWIDVKNFGYSTGTKNMDVLNTNLKDAINTIKKFQETETITIKLSEKEQIELDK